MATPVKTKARQHCWRAFPLSDERTMPGCRKQKTPLRSLSGVFLITSLTITYFHTGCSTIIGAKSFHGPVRDGKGWYQLAMVIRHDLSVLRPAAAAHRMPPAFQTTQTGRSSRIGSCTGQEGDATINVFVLQVVSIGTLHAPHSAAITIKVIGTSRTGN